MSFIAGPFTAAYGSSPTTLGQIEDGVTHSYRPSYEEIRGDNMGDTLQDGVYRGVEVFISFTLLEADAAGLAAIIWPWHGTLGTMGTIGRLMTNIKTIGTPGGSLGTGSLKLTAVAGTTAATVPATRTYHLAMLPNGFDVSQLLAPRLRRTPIRLQVIPTSGGVLWSDT